MIDHGSLVLEGAVDELKGRSPRRELRIAVDGRDGDGDAWARATPGVRIVSSGAEACVWRWSRASSRWPSSTPPARPAGCATSGWSRRASRSFRVVTLIILLAPLAGVIIPAIVGDDGPGTTDRAVSDGSVDAAVVVTSPSAAARVVVESELSETLRGVIQ